MRPLIRRARPRRGWGYATASIAALTDRAETLSRATGQSPGEGAAVVVQELERAAAELNTRTAPLVPGCGVLVAISGLAAKAEPSSSALSETFVSLAVLFAIGGFSFLTRALFLYVGRRTIGLSPTLDDIAFARDRLVRKQASAQRGGVLAGIGLACLIIGILIGVRISVG